MAGKRKVHVAGRREVHRFRKFKLCGGDVRVSHGVKVRVARALHGEKALLT